MTVVAYPVTPTVERLRGTLLDVVDPGNWFEWNDGVGLYDSYNCMNFIEDTPFCAADSKTFDESISWVDGYRFAVYGGVVCKPLGLDMSRMRSEIERVFKNGESRGIEMALMQHRFNANAAGSDDPGEWTAPTDLTPAGGAVPIRTGIGLLEGHAASNYAGNPTLHLPRTVASIATSVDTLEFDGNMLRTKLGSKVAAGGGYQTANSSPAGAAPAAGEYWLYATGEVSLAQSELQVLQAVETTDNDVFVLAERGYIAAVDCYAAGVRVNLTA